MSAASQARASRPGRAKTSTKLTAALTIGGTVAFVIAIAIALLSGCSGDLHAAVSLKVARSPETPRDASVTIDEQYIGPLGYVAAHGVRLRTGEHRISVEKNGYFPFDQLLVAGSDDLKVEVKLVPVPD